MSDTQNIMNAFRRVVRALRLNSTEIQTQSGLSGAQLFVLQTIHPSEALSVNEIASRTNTDQSSVSVVIAKLVAKKLLTREPAAEDRRKALHSLSPTGKKIATHSHTLVQNHLMRSIDSLSQADKAVLSQLLTKVIAGAELYAEPATLFFEDEGKKKKYDHLRNDVDALD